MTAMGGKRSLPAPLTRHLDLMNLLHRQLKWVVMHFAVAGGFPSQATGESCNGRSLKAARDFCSDRVVKRPLLICRNSLNGSKLNPADAVLIDQVYAMGPCRLYTRPKSKKLTVERARIGNYFADVSVDGILCGLYGSNGDQSREGRKQFRISSRSFWAHLRSFTHHPNDRNGSKADIALVTHHYGCRHQARAVIWPPAALFELLRRSKWLLHPTLQMLLFGRHQALASFG
jgi:hypothetical protein